MEIARPIGYGSLLWGLERCVTFQNLLFAIC